jgi:hypothetical protein
MHALGGERQIAALMEIEVPEGSRGAVVGVAVDRGFVHERAMIGAGARGPVDVGRIRVRVQHGHPFSSNLIRLTPASVCCFVSTLLRSMTFTPSSETATIPLASSIAASISR